MHFRRNRAKPTPKASTTARRLRQGALALSVSVLLGGCYVVPVAPAQVSGTVVVRPAPARCWHPGHWGPWGVWHPGHWGWCG
jgi:hypothetical protein